MHKEKDLLDACLTGSECMRKALFDQYLPILHAISRRYSGSETEAEDLTQEAYIRVFKYLHTFKWNGEGSLLKWMKTVFINHAINTYKIAQKHNEYNQSDSIEFYRNEQALHFDTDSVIDQALEVFSYNDIISAVSLLPEQFRMVFNLYAVEEMKHKEIAKVLNIPLKTSTTRYLRAKEKLKVILEKELQKAEPVTSKVI